jgi:LuxR family transcriptional regulator, maltose regulon positive regulatory protein
MTSGAGRAIRWPQESAGAPGGQGLVQHRRTGSQAMLEQAERAGLFLVPLDEVRGWRRYHRLFAGLLRTRLQAERPRRMQELHRAAAWSDEHSLADDAVRHALAPGDTL